MECPELHWFAHFGLFAATHFHLTSHLTLAAPLAEMGHGCHTCIRNTKYALHNFEKVDFKLLYGLHTN